MVNEEERKSFEDGIKYQKAIELMEDSLETCRNYLEGCPFPSRDVMACLDNAEAEYNEAKELLIKYEHMEGLNRLMGRFDHLKFLKEKIANLRKKFFPRESIEAKVEG